MNLVIFGIGYSGLAIARELSASGAIVTGTTRKERRFAEIRAAGAKPELYAGEGFSAALAAKLAEATHIVVSIAPDHGGDPLLADFAAGLKSACPKLEWVGYLSTVGVYGDHDGGWVDEETACRPVSRRSMARVEAETAWADLCARDGVPLAILRLSGIYGPGKNALANLAAGTARRLVKPGQVFNRIHVEDIAGATALLAGKRAGGIFNVTDDEPAPPQDVVAFAATLMGVEPPPETDFSTADLSPMARSFYGENKRVSNAKIRALGYAFRHPDYRAALTNLWRSGTWRPAGL
jgi:nucleoside-diphosphate-sugar epimerase